MIIYKEKEKVYIFGAEGKLLIMNYQNYLYARKLYQQHLIPVFQLLNNFFDVKSPTHKFKRLFVKKFYAYNTNQSQIRYCKFN